MNGELDRRRNQVGEIPTWSKRDDANEQTLLRERETRNTKGSKRDQRWGRVQVKQWNIKYRRGKQ